MKPAATCHARFDLFPTRHTFIKRGKNPPFRSRHVTIATQIYREETEFINKRETMSAELRKELAKLEKECEKVKVCVTGGSGFLGSAVVRRLLSAGHSVHVACLQSEIDHPQKLSHLKEMQGAEERLKFFASDLLKEGSFAEAMKGCKYVIHMAAIVKMHAKDPYRNIVAPALQGVDNVLGSVCKTEGIERVVMTSSLAAIITDNHSKGAGVPFTEKDWSKDLKVEERPYHYAKTMSEKRAWEIAKSQNKWSLVVVNPGIVFGPVVTAQHALNGSMHLLAIHFKGIGWPFKYSLYTGITDVEDVAQAHVLAMLNPHAQGRYFCVSETVNLPEYFNSQRRIFPQYWYPFLGIPTFVIYWIVVICTYLGINHLIPSSPQLVKDCCDKPLAVNTNKIQQELGISYIDPKITLRDSVISLQLYKIIKQ